MSLSKKDKIVLITLVFVLVFAIFIMYGIMPVSNELKEAEKKHEELKKEVDALIQEYNNPASKPQNIEDKIEKSLMSYYQNDKKDIVVDDELGAEIEFKKTIGGNIQIESGTIILNCNLDEVKVTTKSVVFDESGIEPQGVNLLKASVPCLFEIADLQQIVYVFNYLNNNEDDLMYENIKANKTSDTGKYSCSCVIYKYYIDDPENIPLPLVDDYTTMELSNVADAPEMPYVDNGSKFIKFNVINYAKYYEIYEVVDVKENEEHIRYDYVLVDSKIESENGYDVKYYYEGKLQQNKRYVVTAVGNYNNAEAIENGEKLYYRTILTEFLADKSFTVM